MSLARHFTAESYEPVGDELINQLADQALRIEEWIGYDADKTLFYHESGSEYRVLEFGKPIQPMIDHLIANLDAGKKVKIFTARVSYVDERVNDAVRAKLVAIMLELTGRVLEITCVKDCGMRKIYDDRAFHVIPNEGVIVEPPKNSPAAVKEFYAKLREDLGQ
jgi:hypothetical protein